MNDYSTIPLSKRSKKYAGLYAAKISPEDVLLAELNWTVLITDNVLYAVRTIKGAGKKRKMLLLHRVIAEQMFGELSDDIEIDHIDGDGLNNQRSNLRRATKAQNSRNRGATKRSTTGLKGVSLYKATGRYSADIKKDGIRYFLGYFDTKEEAYEAYCKKGQELHEEFWNGGNNG